MRHRRLHAALLTAALALPAVSKAGDDGVDPNQTKPALAFLLAASNDAIPAKSSCNGNYGQSGTATIKDLLSTQFAYMYQGKSVVKGKCQGQREKKCSITINRDAGEDVSSATIDFTVQRGRLKPDSLSCVITP